MSRINRVNGFIRIYRIVVVDVTSLVREYSYGCAYASVLELKGDRVNLIFKSVKNIFIYLDGASCRNALFYSIFALVNFLLVNAECLEVCLVAVACDCKGTFCSQSPRCASPITSLPAYRKILLIASPITAGRRCPTCKGFATLAPP